MYRLPIGHGRQKSDDVLLDGNTNESVIYKPHNTYNYFPIHLFASTTSVPPTWSKSRIKCDIICSNYCHRQFIYQGIVPWFPEDAQELFLNPPTFSNPSSFLPLFRLISPYIGYFIIFVAFIIVWSTVSSIFGYFSRFLRFSLRLAPLIGIAAWIMQASGQGSMGELMQLAKQWSGLAAADNGAGAGQSNPGIAYLSSLFSGNQDSSSTSKGRKTTTPRSKYSTRSSTKDKASGRRGKASHPAPDSGADFISSFLSSAVGSRGEEGAASPWQNMVQDYVKQSVLKASHLDWLFSPPEKKDIKKQAGTR